MKEEIKFNPQSFGVIGAGPVGCIVAAFLAKGGYDVTLCDVLPHLIEPAKGPGIIIEGAENLQQVVSKTCNDIDDLADQRPDVIFLTVKANSLPLIAASIENFYREGIYIVSWQNGIDTELVVARLLERKAVMRAVVNYGCSLLNPCHVHMGFHHAPHYIQELETESRDAAIAISRALTVSGLATQHTDQIVSMVWRKSIMNACMNPVCAVTGMTMAQAMNDPIVFQIVDALVKEGVKVARENEIALGWDFYSYCMEYLKNAGDHKPSMLMDIEIKRMTEIDYINGKIVDYGERAGIDTPYNRTLRALIKALESK
ncbi:MAG: 2-dehydropantoate 2-reductase [Thermodesulfobacteriota bacterium]|nr:2-dehydropantoate 2-reductase [Thermodesulfobacteriota bacterium]